MIDRRQLGLTKLTLACLATTALIGGCSSPSTSTKQGTEVQDVVATSTSTSTEDDSDGGALGDSASARVDEVLAMGEAERDAAAAEAGLELELAVAKESGLEAELGGPDATRDALVSAWAPLVEQAVAVRGSNVPSGFRRVATAAPAIGEGFFAGLLLGALSADSAVSNASTGETGAETVTQNGFTVTQSGSLNRGEFALEGTNVDGATGVTTKLVTKTSAVPCPDADGRFEIEAVIDVTVSKGTAGQRGVLDVKVVGHVDDDAHLASSDLDYTMNWSRTSGGATELVNLSGSVPSSGGGSSTVERTGGAATSDLEASATVGAQMYSMLMEHFLTAAAQKGWESGRCVRIDVKAEPGPKDVKPGGTSDITAAPRSTMDGGPVGGNVIATFAGQLAVEPNGSPVPADAAFVYTAPTDGLPTSGTVSLEARSRRGVGKAEISFEVDRPVYVASGGGGGITFSGSTQVPDLNFTLTGDFEGGSATFDFSSDMDADGDRLPTGVVTITGGGSGATVTGDGTYTMAANPDGTLTVTMTTHACVDVSGLCRDSTNVITLTPQS